MPYFVNPRFKEHVGALCAKYPGDDDATPVGTCFFVYVENSEGRVFDYLVTGRHVVDELRKISNEWVLRVNRGRVGESGQGVMDVPVTTQGWLYHEDDHVDMAVLPSYWAQAPTAPEEDVFRYLRLRLDPHAQKPNPWPPLEGMDVLFIAMTMQFKGTRANLPTVRRGWVSLVTNEPLRGEYGLAEYYVVQAQIYPGNSGSPIWVEYNNGWHMLGMLVFAYPGDEELAKLKDTTKIYVNLGLSLVVPIERLMEIVFSDKETKRRDSKGGPHRPGVAASASPDDDREPPFTREAMEAALRKVSRPDGREIIEKQDQASSQT